jgi:hypothetical protein
MKGMLQDSVVCLSQPTSKNEIAHKNSKQIQSIATDPTCASSPKGLPSNEKRKKILARAHVEIDCKEALL